MVLSGVYVTVCLLLLVVVLLQQGKGGDIAAAFGGGGTQAAFGARAGATLLTRVTTVLGALFMLGALVLAIIGQRGPGSVVSGLDGAPAAPVEAGALAEPVTSGEATGAASDESASDAEDAAPAPQ